MDISVQQKLQTYITAELGDAMLYTKLSKIAPTESARLLLLEFAKDEQAHAEEFMRIYKTMFGRSFNPEINSVELSGTYREILRDRVLDESGDFRKYGEQYIQTYQNIALKNAYYRARTDENVHALRLLYLLNE